MSCTGSREMLGFVLCVSCLSDMAARKVGTTLVSLRGAEYPHQGGIEPALLKPSWGIGLPDGVSLQDSEEERAGGKAEVLRVSRTMAEDVLGRVLLFAGV